MKQVAIETLPAGTRVREDNMWSSKMNVVFTADNGESIGWYIKNEDGDLTHRPHGFMVWVHEPTIGELYDSKAVVHGDTILYGGETFIFRTTTEPVYNTSRDRVFILVKLHRLIVVDEDEEIEVVK